MLVRLQPLQTELRRLHEIPTTFFQNIEAASAFDDALFPAWTDIAFAGTHLKAKFKAIYDKYKAIAEPTERMKVINAFTNNNQIENLCRNQAGLICIPLLALDDSIRDEIEKTFHYLYNTAINHDGFTAYISDNIRDAIDRFIQTCNMQICPICGLEGYLNLDGQARLPLDHWLCKDIFPFTAVNFDNLFPLGDKCNGRPAKGDTNILVDEHGSRVVAFYPFLNHHSVTTTFTYNNEPSMTPLADTDWNLNIAPTDASEQILFESWNSIFNILQRYKDYFRKYVFPMWENNYKRYIEDSGIGHANNVADLRVKLVQWRATFQINTSIGAVLHRAFIGNMIYNVSEPYLYSLCENFKRQSA
jgi:hypothetical protein